MNPWIPVTILLFFIAGFFGGWLYSETLDKNAVMEQCNQFIENHCLCYENKPTTYNNPQWEWNINFTELKNGTRKI